MEKKLFGDWWDNMNKKIKEQHHCTHPETCCIDDLLAIIKRNVMKAFGYE